MSRSVSAPSSVTKTSPCWNGFIVPGSTFRYGSSFCMETLSPRATRRLPRLEAVSPLPSEEATPPVTKRCLVSFARGPTGLQPISDLGTATATRPDRAHVPRPGRCSAGPGEVRVLGEQGLDHVVLGRPGGGLPPAGGGPPTALGRVVGQLPHGARRRHPVPGRDQDPGLPDQVRY